MKTLSLFQSTKRTLALTLAVAMLLSLTSFRSASAMTVDEGTTNYNGEELHPCELELYDDYAYEEDYYYDDTMWDEIDQVISETDWNTLSMAQIDAKLKDAGLETWFDPQDPLYNLTVKEIDNLTDAEWDKIDEQYEKLWEEEDQYWEQVDSIIGDSDWDTLSMAQIDEKLKAAGLEAMHDPQDPLYNYTVAQIEALTEQEWEAIDKAYADLYGYEYYEYEDEWDDNYWDEVDSVISDDEWMTLSMADIDAKLKAAGIETWYDPQDPLYSYSQEQIDALTDEEWDAIDEQYAELYGWEDWDDDWEDDPCYEYWEEKWEAEDAYWDEVDSVISEDDWMTLSQEEIDQKLVAAGLEPFGDPLNPLYSYTEAEIENFTDEEWEEIDELFEEYYETFDWYDEEISWFDDYWDQVDEVITEQDWATLSQREINTKLQEAGLEPYYDEEDPLYEYTQDEIDNFTEEDWEKIDDLYDEYYDDFDWEEDDYFEGWEDGEGDEDWYDYDDEDEDDEDMDDEDDEEDDNEDEDDEDDDQ